MQNTTKKRALLSGLLMCSLIIISPDADAGFIKKILKKTKNIITTGKASGKKVSASSRLPVTKEVPQYTSDSCPVNAIHDVLKIGKWKIINRGNGIGDSFVRATVTKDSYLTCEYKSKLKISKKICTTKRYALNRKAFLGKPNTKTKSCYPLTGTLYGFSADEASSRGESRCKSLFGSTKLAGWEFHSIGQPGARDEGVIKASIHCAVPR